MEEGILKLGDGTTIVVNGGNPLQDCPQSWEDAERLEMWLNDNRNKEDVEGPCWDFNCGFKLDYDGPIVSVSSRFYPPKTHRGATWDGTVSVYVVDQKVSEKKFDCATVQELKQQVDEYINGFIERIKSVF